MSREKLISPALDLANIVAVAEVEEKPFQTNMNMCQADFCRWALGSVQVCLLNCDTLFRSETQAGFEDKKSRLRL